MAAIDRLAKEADAGGELKGELGGLRRIRVGAYRIVYEIFERALTILVVRAADHRKAYR